MKICSSLGSGFTRTLKSWKGVLLLWLFSLILVSLIVMPFRGAVKSAFGSSMITERLADGFDPEVFLDLGPVFRTTFSSLISGFLFLLTISFIVNSFLTGGLFESLKKGKERFSFARFFEACSRNFWSFLLISFTVTIIFMFISGAILGLTAAVVSGSEALSEKSMFIYQIAAFAIVALIIPVFLLAADFARAGKVADIKITGLNMIGYGFSKTFSKFWSSYVLMLILLLCQLLFTAVVFYLVPVWRPVTGKGVLLLFLISQVLVFIMYFLKTWRYGSVTALLENK